MTSAIGAPGAGRLRRHRRGRDVADGVARVVLGGDGVDGSARSASPPTDCEHPATSTDAAISTAIRIPARLAGRHAIAGQARRRVVVRYRRVMHEHTVRATIDSGTIEGFTRDGVHRWRSIPYARPPVGRLRFRAPQPVEPWPGVRYCHGFGYCAPQQRMYTIVSVGKYQPMSEDCLTLNVTAPESPADRAAARDGLHPRRRLHPGQLGDADLRRRRPGAAGMRVCLGQLPARRAGLHGPVVAVHSGQPDRRQPVPARPGDGAALGSRQHRRVRRRPGQRDDLRRERRRARRRHPAGRSAGQRPVRPGDFGKPGQRDGPFRRSRREVRRPLRRPARRTTRRRRRRADGGPPGRPGRRARPSDRPWHEGHARRVRGRTRVRHRLPADGSGGGHARGQGAPGAADRRQQRRRGPAVHPVPPAVCR